MLSQRRLCFGNWFKRPRVCSTTLPSSIWLYYTTKELRHLMCEYVTNWFQRSHINWVDHVSCKLFLLHIINLNSRLYSYIDILYLLFTYAASTIGGQVCSCFLTCRLSSSMLECNRDTRTIRGHIRANLQVLHHWQLLHWLLDSKGAVNFSATRSLVMLTVARTAPGCHCNGGWWYDFISDITAVLSANSHVLMSPAGLAASHWGSWPNKGI